MPNVSLVQLLKLYPDDAAAEKRFVRWRWPGGIACPHCGDTDIQEGTPHPDMPYRCRGCTRFFAVKTRSVMQGSKIGYRGWLIAMYCLLTNPKGTSSMQLHGDLGITQKSAWHLAHRIREAWTEFPGTLGGEVEVDETFVGGKEKNKHGSMKKGSGYPTPNSLLRMDWGRGLLAIFLEAFLLVPLHVLALMRLLRRRVQHSLGDVL